MRTRGVTLPELLIVLLLAGMAVQTTIGPARRQAERMVLLGAREELVALFHRARMEARVHGDARIVAVEGGDPGLLRGDGGPPLRVDLASRGIELVVGGGRSSVEFDYGPLGVAHFASATLVLRRGRTELPLVVSGYGRVRR